MNQYLLSVYEVEGQVGSVPATPEEMRAFMGRVIALEEQMDAAGAFVFGGALHGPDTATVVSGGTGLDRVTTDGPFVEAKEHIGGFYVINAADLDDALVWAEKVVEAIRHPIDICSGRYLELVPDRRIVFTYGWERTEVGIPPGSTTVEIDLVADGPATTLLKLVHRGIGHTAADAHHGGWTHYLGRLRTFAQGEPPGPDLLTDRRVPSFADDGRL